MACSDRDYAYLREVVLTQSANTIDPSRNALFETRLTAVAQRAGATDLKGLVCMLRDERAPHLQRAVAEAMTVNETSFFRDVRPFELLRLHILPQLVATCAETRRLRIWSGASSTGQEAYSLAMLLCESFPQLATWDVKVIGTDISREVVEYARRGRYRRLEVNRGLPARLLLKYFVREGDEWLVSPKLRGLCEFHCANLCTSLPWLPVCDLVLLRNVLLYFARADRATVFSEVHRHLRPDGYLLLGGSEQAEDSTDLFKAEFAQETYFYRPLPRK